MSSAACVIGTTGALLLSLYEARYRYMGELIARCLVAANLTKSDIIHNAYGYGLFTGGLGLHYGAEKLGPVLSHVRRQHQAPTDDTPGFRSNGNLLHSFLCAEFAEQGQAMGIDMRSLKLRVGIFGAEPWSEQMCRQIEEAFDIKALNIYGLSEIMGRVLPWNAATCRKACIF